MPVKYTPILTLSLILVFLLLLISSTNYQIKCNELYNNINETFANDITTECNQSSDKQQEDKQDKQDKQQKDKNYNRPNINKYTFTTQIPRKENININLTLNLKDSDRKTLQPSHWTDTYTSSSLGTAPISYMY